MSTKMKTTKPKKKCVAKPTSATSVATQTTDLDVIIEMAKLQQQMKLLQIENDTLRQHMLPVPAPATSKINNEKSVCCCKGNCTTKRCGCIKKNNKCDSTCKCNSVAVCQNQEMLEENPAQGNKENVNIKIKNNNVQDNKMMMNIQDDAINNLNIKFDPMKPRHQLSRTPPKNKENINEESAIKLRYQLSRRPNDRENINVGSSIFNNKTQSQRHETKRDITEQKIKSYNIKDIEKEEIAWERHPTQLVPCKKCKRTFMPNRIKKHEACCKNI